MGKMQDCGVKIDKLDEKNDEEPLEHIPRLKRNEICQLTEDEELSMGIC